MSFKVPISQWQERWDVYADAGTRERVRCVLGPRESLSEFTRAALKRELVIRERRAARRAQEEEEAAS